MDYSKGNIIKFDNGDYLVIDIIKNDNDTYLYLINNNEFINDVAIVKVQNNDGIVEYSHITNDKEFNFVLNKLFLNSKDDMVLFAINE